MRRKPISKKLRFEVFKRDKFRCQYCGRPSPEVLLRVDHIEPIAKGGSNEIVNLITSCEDCNSGKGSVRLDDESLLEKTRLQMEQLQERRNQIELMMAWKKGLVTGKALEVDRAAEFWCELMKVELTEHGLKRLAFCIKKFGLEAVVDAMPIAAERFSTLGSDGRPTMQSVELAFSKIEGICALAAMPKSQKDARYIRGIIKNRFSDQISTWTARHREERLSRLLSDIEFLLESGVSFEDLSSFAKTVSSFSRFEIEVEKQRFRPDQPST